MAPSGWTVNEKKLSSFASAAARRTSRRVARLKFVWAPAAPPENLACALAKERLGTFYYSTLYAPAYAET